MPITYKQAKEAVAKWAGPGGQCSSSKIDIFVRQVLEHMMYQGAYGSLRKFCFCAVKGCITAPYELEIPLKVKIDDYNGNVWSKWFEWYSSNTLEEGCIDATKALYEEPNYTPIAYDIPSCGAYIGVVGTCAEATDAHVIVKGKDLTGREVFTDHKGEKVAGEYLSIVKGTLRYSTVKFGVITEIYKTPTSGYVQLYAVDPAANAKVFLSDYSPVEETPQYRRFRLSNGFPFNDVSKVSILGRIRLKPAYADNDLIPFDNLYALSLAAQTIYASYNNDIQGAQAKGNFLSSVIENENNYKRVDNGQPIEVSRVTSSANIANVNGSIRYPRWRRNSTGWIPG